MTGRIEKTVFISYRRTNMSWALAIYQHLTGQGYDVFFDYLSIPSGDFEKIIGENIRGRAHFIVILTPSALERCGEPGDWLRREIETAMDNKRNIVPLMLESFDYGSPAVVKALTGKLENLKKYNSLRVPSEYFFEAMNRLRQQFLNVALDAVIHPISDQAKQVTEEHQIAAGNAMHVEQRELTAQEWLEKGFFASDLEEQIRYNTEAIRLKPDLAEAYYNRGIAHSNKGDHDSAIEDYTRSIELNFVESYLPYNNRGLVRRANGDLDGAIADYTQVILLKRDLVEAYYNRGNARRDKGDLDGAIADYTKAINLKPEYVEAIFERGLTYQIKGDGELAIKDYESGMRLKPDDGTGRSSLINVLRNWTGASQSREQ